MKLLINIDNQNELTRGTKQIDLRSLIITYIRFPLYLIIACKNRKIIIQKIDNDNFSYEKYKSKA